jgi:hypothetical protein
VHFDSNLQKGLKGPTVEKDGKKGCRKSLFFMRTKWIKTVKRPNSVLDFNLHPALVFSNFQYFCEEQRQSE